MKRRTVMFLGNPIYHGLERTDFRKVYGEDITDAFVQYDPKTETVFVDERATWQYAKYAAIHECICQGEYHHLAPKMDDQNNRCKNIDWLIIAAMPEYDRKAYIEKRIEALKAMLSRGINPEMKESYARDLSMLVDTLHSLG